MKGRHFLPLTVLSTAALAGGLPRVAPPGPGMSSSPSGDSRGSVEELYRRRLDAGDSTTAPVRRAPGPSVLYPTTSGAITDTGVPLHGRSGVLRDPGGGVWNCTGTGCFSPNGTFLPMTKTPPPAPQTE